TVSSDIQDGDLLELFLTFGGQTFVLGQDVLSGGETSALITPDTPAPAGSTYDLQVRIVRNGVAGGASGVLSVQIDAPTAALPPSLAGITPDLTHASDTGIGYADNSTTDTRPTFHVNLSAVSSDILDGDLLELFITSGGREFIVGQDVLSGGDTSALITPDLPLSVGSTYALSVRIMRNGVAGDASGVLQTQIVAPTTILAEDLDGDGAADDYEATRDGNGDGIRDDLQATVATYATSQNTSTTIAVKAIERSYLDDQSSGGSLQASTELLFEGIADRAETRGQGSFTYTISALEAAVGQASQVLAVSNQPRFSIAPNVVVTGTVDPTLEAQFRADVKERFSNTIQQVDLYFDEDPTKAWNALFKPDRNGGYFFFAYDPGTGLGGMLLDRDNDGVVDGARLFLKDGERGDLDGVRNGVIEDPVGLASLAAPPTLRVSDDGLGLVVDGVAGTGLWLDIQAISADAKLHNSLDLVARNGTELGSVGGTPDSGNLGSKEIYLAAGEELRFAQFGLNNARNTSPDILIIADQGGFLLQLDDHGSLDRDYNDLVLRITSSLTPSDPNAIAMARLQRNSGDAILDLTAISSTGARVTLSILADCGYTNRLGLVKLGGDALTGYFVGGVAAGNTDAFRSAVRDNLINPGGSPISAGGHTARTAFWDVTSADAGIYAPVLINPNGQVFTFGATASDGSQHVTVLGSNTFGFEDLVASQGSDWDFNDLRVQFTMA
ncbi:MAG: hypothetical protein RLZZ516_2201, partial [Cyanobacteriota bacterium]